MFIKRVTLRSFGRLRGSVEFRSNRCSIVCQPNEQGKTTLADAILYTFFDFPRGRQRRGALKPGRNTALGRARPMGPRSRSSMTPAARFD